jgi:hypothetical protein
MAVPPLLAGKLRKLRIMFASIERNHARMSKQWHSDVSDELMRSIQRLQGPVELAAKERALTKPGGHRGD